jgi:hypothetical protein
MRRFCWAGRIRIFVVLHPSRLSGHPNLDHLKSIGEGEGNLSDTVDVGPDLNRSRCHNGAKQIVWWLRVHLFTILWFWFRLEEL